jgi:hypothetical protein
MPAAPLIVPGLRSTPPAEPGAGSPGTAFRHRRPASSAIYKLCHPDNRQWLVYVA